MQPSAFTAVQRPSFQSSAPLLADRPRKPAPTRGPEGPWWNRPMRRD